MKASTKIKKYCPEAVSGDTVKGWIVFIVDGYKIGAVKKLDEADKVHNDLVEKYGCTLLPLAECPFVNTIDQVIMHYTTTTYKEWCNA